MTRRLFNDEWAYRAKVSPFAELGGAGGAWTSVTLPHDAIIGTERQADWPAARPPATSPAGVRVPDVPRGRCRGRGKAGRAGVRRRAIATRMVYVNGALAGQRAFGYSRFLVRVDPYLRFGEENEIRVECRAHQDSRWYTGAGIYRDVRLIIEARCPHRSRWRAHLHPGHRGRPGSRRGRCRRREHRSRHHDGAPGVRDRRGRSSLTWPATARRSPCCPASGSPSGSGCYVARPALWACESPSLYTARLELRDGDELDRRGGQSPFGIRSLQVDPKQGAAHQRQRGEAAGRLHPPRQRPARRRVDRARRGAPDRAAQGRRLQRGPERAQPDQLGAAGRVRPTRDARHGRDVRHVDLQQVRLRLRVRLPPVVGARRGGDRRQGHQPPQCDHVLDRQRDPRDRQPVRWRLEPTAGGEDPLPRPDPTGHQRHQRVRLGPGHGRGRDEAPRAGCRGCRRPGGSTR